MRANRVKRERLLTADRPLVSLGPLKRGDHDKHRGDVSELQVALPIGNALVEGLLAIMLSGR
jgi:hypothetical protein